MIDKPPFLNDAAMITEFQTCRRRFLLSRKWRSLRWKPKLLFDACLRQGILDLGNAKSVEDTVLEATTRFMAVGASPGLDIAGYDPFKAALDYCACLETILHALSLRSPLNLRPVASKRVDTGIEWVFLAHADSDGELHRTVTVDRFDDDRLSQEIHSWYVMGDVCMAKKPLHLRFIEIGQMRDGRRHSPWSRAWEHSAIRGRIKFQGKGNKKLQGDAWKATFLADSTVHTASSWVDAMFADDVPDTLIHDVEVTVPSAEHIVITKRDIRTESVQMMEWMRLIEDPLTVPMSRSACDVPYPCQYQAVCFNPIIDVDIRQLGLYKPR